MHIPVLPKEVIEYLDPRPGDRIIDGTINGGGHARAILERIGSEGALLGIDLDKDQLATLRKQFQHEKRTNVFLAHDNFRAMKGIAEQFNLLPVNGILLDLGFSSNQIENSGRGFSFLKDEPLDMRFNPDNPVTAEIIVNSSPKDELKEIIREFGEEGFYHQIGDAIYDARRKKRITRTTELVRIIEDTVPEFYKHKKIHAATKTFQTLRIAVNDELGNLKAVLGDALSILDTGGRLVIISFHGLEDTIVKETFKKWAGESHVSLLTKKTVQAAFPEVKENPRARSAKLRAVVKK